MKTICSFVTLIVTVFMVCQYPSAQVIAERQAQYRDYIPGQPVPITVTIEGTESTEITVVETLPEGWLVGEVNRNVTVSDSVITWITTIKPPRVIELIYHAYPPETATGDATFSGQINGIVISGIQTLPQAMLKPIGIFQDHRDMWYSGTPGDAGYENGQYWISGRYIPPFDPANRFGYHFVYSEVKGNFILKARTSIKHSSPDPKVYGALWAVNSFEPEAVYYVFFIETETNGEGFAKAIWRDSLGGYFTFSAEVLDSEYDYLELVRDDQTFSTYYYELGIGKRVHLHSKEMPNMDYSILVGLIFSSTDEDSRGYYSDVELITASLVSEWELY